MLDPIEGDSLVIGEGIETCLSMRAGIPGYLDPQWPVWCMRSTSGIAKVPLVPGVMDVTVGIEHDQNSTAYHPSERRR